MDNPFDMLADRYDKWFESERGASVFQAELACLEAVMPRSRPGCWLEVGVGTGRFAAALGVSEGIDSSAAVLEYAADRGIRTRQAKAEELPYADGTLQGVLMVVTLCFVRDPARALAEAARVLVPAGALILGLVPAESAWGRLYARKGRAGHPFYAAARFYTCVQVIEMAQTAGFAFEGAAHTLRTPPGRPVDPSATPRPGLTEAAGFAAFRFSRGPAVGTRPIRAQTRKTKNAEIR